MEKKELPLILIDHTATKIDNDRFLVAGGWDQNVTKTFKINKWKQTNRFNTSAF